MHVVPIPCNTTDLPSRSSEFWDVVHVDGATGGGVGGGGGGGGATGPHHFALCPPLHMPRHLSFVMQPNFVLHRPQLHDASQAYPHALHGDLAETGTSWMHTSAKTAKQTARLTIGRILIVTSAHTVQTRPSVPINYLII